jgi:hypothetical protein
MNVKSPASQRHLLSVFLVAVILSGVSSSLGVDTIRCQLADGFDFPVGKPDGTGYYKARGFYPNGHLGEDWNGRGGGDSDLGDPIYSMGIGVVVQSENIGVGWGNVVIVRHAFRDVTGKIEMVDSLYGHLQRRDVKLHDIVARGQQVGTMGSNNGMYYVHLHFEVRKNLKIGMNRSQFGRDYSNYYSPTAFITPRRHLQSGLQRFEMPVNTFAAYGKSLADIEKGSAGNSISIPVFPGGANADKTKPEDKIMPKETPAPAGNTQSAEPARATVPDEQLESDFWTRLKLKLKQGKLTDEGKK